MNDLARSMVALVALAVASSAALAAETETIYLTGKGKDDAVQWDFWCSAGQNANAWSKIGVPSNWELQRFGIYTYGRESHNPWPKVQGKYKRTFTAPADAAGKKVFLVFEGSMTDTQAFVNGQSAGPMHQGGYYRFKYDVSALLKPGENLLEVTVDDDSANESINAAERRGDYWNYAGIFRPVYLEVVPAQSIDRVAIDAKADGSFDADVFIDVPNRPQAGGGGGGALTCEAQLLDLDGKPVGAAFSKPFANDDRKTRVTTKVASPRLWNAETPNLYQVEFRLKDATGAVVHSVRQKFGFRTLEVRAGAGLFLNGSRIMLKGSDRHSFWPDSGRCLSEQISRDDISLMKQMNMNAVRMSHYPPDQHFLDACDEMGMYVLDELAGWQHPYDTPSATRLVGETVVRDVNHPSILFWDNGNEGGWNSAVDDEYAKWDPQARRVLHPQQTIRGIDNSHYPLYGAVVTKSAGDMPFFPTEFLHGLYDGGAGAGLEDYWKVMSHSKVASGGFIWAFLDEDVVRTDRGGKLDSSGNSAPDGIVGPYREKEGSFYSIRQIWSPVVVTDKAFPADGVVTVENHYGFTDLKQCTFAWETRKFHGVGERVAGYAVVDGGKTTLDGAIAPGASGKLHVGPPAGTALAGVDAIALTAKDPAGKELWTWVWPTRDLTYRPASPQGGAKVDVSETPAAFKLTAGELSLTFDRHTGLLASASRAGKSFSLAKGPRLLSAVATVAAPRNGRRSTSAPVASAPTSGATSTSAPAAEPAVVLQSFTQSADGADRVLSAKFTGPMKSITYRLHPNGWLSIDYAYALAGPHAYFGVGFDYPEANVHSMRYLGEGPMPVYQNRLAGGTLDVWEKKYNNTIVGDPADLKAGEHFDYPIFKGFYSGVRWLELQTTEGPITAVLNSSDLFVQVYSPKLPENPGNAVAMFPPAGINFLHAIPAVGTKFNPPVGSGPMGEPAVAKGSYTGSISLYFGSVR